MSPEIPPEPLKPALNNDYSHGQATRWTKWIGHLAGQPDLKFLEVGSYEGQSALWFLKNILTDPTSKLLCVDTWNAGGDMPYVEGDRLLTTFLDNIDPYRANCGIMRGKSQDVLRSLPDEHYDFIYIDAAHDAASVLADSVLAWPLLKVGGIIVYDDYLWEPYDDPIRQPKMAVDAFLACYEGQYEVVAKEWQVCLKKLTLTLKGFTPP